MLGNSHGYYNGFVVDILDPDQISIYEGDSILGPVFHPQLFGRSDHSLGDHPDLSLGRSLVDEINLPLGRSVVRNNDGQGSFFSLTFGSSDVPDEKASFDEGLDLLLQLNTIVRVMAMVAIEATVLRLVSIARRLHRERLPKVSFVFNFHQYLRWGEWQRSIARSTIVILRLWASRPNNLDS